MIAAGSTSGENAPKSGERATGILLAIFLGVIQAAWLGLLGWVIYQIAGTV